MTLRHLAGRLEEEPVGELHDVRLVRRGDLLAAVLLGVVEGRLHDPVASELGDRLDRDTRVLANLHVHARE
jgi:hypothetical protein